MYSTFANFYDKLIADLSYSGRAVYFKRLIDTYLPETELILDMGCGTGSLSVELSKLGYDVTGVDISAEMLSVAMGKSYEQEQKILYLCQDIRELDLYGTMDTVICALDTLNHITSKQDILKIFKRLSLFVTDNGLFIFDINTPYKHEHILGNNTFVYDMPEVYCVWQNTFNKEDLSVEISLDFFEEEDGAYYRSQESFREKAYTDSFLKEALNKNDFEVIAVYHEDSFDLPKENSERLIYVTRRKARQ